MEIRTKDYGIWYDPQQETVYCQGFLRLEGLDAYQPIINVLTEAIAQNSNLILDLQELEFLNSSGISMLSMFIVDIRNRGNVHLKVLGSKKVLWQSKSLKNLQRLMPTIDLEFI